MTPCIYYSIIYKTPLSFLHFTLPSLLPPSFNNILYFTVIIQMTCVLYSATETAFLCVFAQHQPLSLRWLHLPGGVCVTTEQWLAKQFIDLRISQVFTVKFRVVPYIGLKSSLLKCFLRCCSSEPFTTATKEAKHT